MESYIELYKEDDLTIMELALACKKKGTSRIEQIKNMQFRQGIKKLVLHTVSP